MAPDLDFLVELKGKLFAWRYHRVALHGVPIALVLGGVIAGAAALSPARVAGLPLLAAVSLLAVLSHLVLDAVTSFGTSLLFPLSEQRFSTRTHFIFDPVVLATLLSGLALQRPALALAACGAYGVLCWLIREAVTGSVERSLAAAGIDVTGLSLEPRPFAPLRWLAVASAGDQYLLANWSPLGIGPWSATQSGRGSSAEAAARRHPLLLAFLATCDFPRFESRQLPGGAGLVVEDAKWWVEPPLRPLAFHALLDADGVPREVRQGRMFARGPVGPPEEPPMRRLEPMPAR